MCDIICPPNTSYNVVPCNMIVIFFPAASNNVLIPLAFLIEDHTVEIIDIYYFYEDKTF